MSRVANVFAVHSVCNSLATALANAYPEPLRTDHPCSFRVLSSGELAGKKEIDNTLGIYLYRVTPNGHLRNTERAHDLRAVTPLALDLHFLLIAWAGGALVEQTIFTWAVRQLYLNPTLTVSSLSPEAGWALDEVIQVLPAELSTEDLMRIWDALDPAYRLSMPFVARIVRIDPDTLPDSLPVVAARFDYGRKQSAAGGAP